MKVRIYKPAPWFTTQSFEDWIVRVRHKPKPENRFDVVFPVDKFDERIEPILDFYQDWVLHPINRVVAKIWPKNRIKIHRYDTWSMDCTLSPIILPMLKQLKETKHGAPYVDLEDVPEDLRPEDGWNELEDGTDDKHFERWDWVLDQMIFSFEKKVEDRWEDEFHSGVSELLFVPIDAEGNELGPPKEIGDRDYDKPEGLNAWKMVHGPNDTSEVDWEGRKAMQERISNGLRLFGKYYENLWD